MKNANEKLMEIMKIVNDQIEEFYNLNDLPAVPNFEDVQETVVLNMPEAITGEEYDSYLCTATILALKNVLNKFSADSEAFNRAFSADVSIGTNQKKLDRIESLLAEAEDEIIDEEETQN